MAPLIRNCKHKIAVDCDLRHSALNMRMSKFLVLQAIKSAVSLPLPGIEPDSMSRPDRNSVNVLVEFLGAFVKLRKATISFVMSVRLSVHTGQLGSH